MAVAGVSYKGFFMPEDCTFKPLGAVVLPVLNHTHKTMNLSHNERINAACDIEEKWRKDNAVRRAHVGGKNG